MPHPSRQHVRPFMLRSIGGRGYLRQRGRSIVVLFLLLLTWTLSLSWGLAQAQAPRSQASPSEAIAQTPATAPATQPATTGTATTGTATIGTVDVVPPSLKLSQDLYLENCASCHIGIPPQVMPTETWRQLLPDSQHYGAQLQPLTGPNLQVVWRYVQNFSRPQAAEEDIPYRVYQSRYFKALHPKVKLPTRVGLSSCVSCHPGADKYDFRSLSAEWQNAP